jgi:hypothetical protein
MAIKKNDPVMLDPESLARSVIRLREWFPDAGDWNVISKIPNSVGLVLSIRTREISFSTAARGVEENPHTAQWGLDDTGKISEQSHREYLCQIKIQPNVRDHRLCWHRQR